MNPPLYQMQISLNVLEHLGINLYSNVPAVLSEVVANSWDADGEKVVVRFQKENDTIIIQDDGVGMTRNQVNDRFLLVGYRRRDGQPGLTAKGRSPMGRKGIGKLSLFSIAEEITVETVQGQERSAFHMKLEDIREAIRQNQGVYPPSAISIDGIDFNRGTRITLKGLKKRQTINTSEALRTRLARRFSVIGPTHGFEVSVNDRVIAPSDRGYYDKLQYVWTYGDFSSLGITLHESRKFRIKVYRNRAAVDERHRLAWNRQGKRTTERRLRRKPQSDRHFRQRQDCAGRYFGRFFPNEVSMQVI